MHDVFICYSSDDRDFAFKACHVLEQNDIKCWILPRNVLSSKDFDTQVKNAINDAKAIVLIGSRNAYHCEFTSREIDMAIRFDKPIVQLRIDDYVHEGVDEYLNHIHSIDIAGKSEEKYYYELVEYTIAILKRRDDLKNSEAFEVFISYSPEDFTHAYAICRELEMVGVACRMAPRAVGSGEDYSGRIENEISGADVFVLVASKHAYDCPEVSDEIDIAVSKNRPRVMLRLDEHVPASLDFYFKNFRWVETSEKSETEYHSDLILALEEEFEKSQINQAEVKYDAFISYSTKDKNFADKICRELEAGDFKCWIAPRNIESGRNLAEQIENAIASSKRLILIFSQHSQRSEYAKREVTTAVEMSRDIISIRLDETFPNDEFSSLLFNASWFDFNILNFNDLMGGVINEMQDVDEDSRSFKYLDDLIHSGADEIVLDSDVILEDAIKLDVDGIVIDADNHVIRSLGKSRLFHVTANNVTIKNAVFADGYCEDSGGAIYNEGDLTLNNCLFDSNTSKDGGGSIYHENGTLTAIDCEFKNNSALKFGGALASFSKTFLKGCVFKSNTAEDGGAAIQLEDELACKDCTFEYNSADYGGALGVLSKGILIDCSFLNNSSKNHSGALVIDSGVVDVRNCEFKHNFSGTFGSAICSVAGNVHLHDCSFEANDAHDEGAIYSERGEIYCVDATFSANKGTQSSCISGGSDYKVVSSQFSDNHGPIINNLLEMNFIDCIFSENHMDSDYIIINNENSSLSLSGGKIIGNEVNGQLIENQGKLSINNLIFEDNTCDNAVLNKREMNLSDVKFKGSNGNIVNENCIFIRKFSEDEIQKRIINIGEGFIERFDIPDEIRHDFSYLDNMLRQAAQDGESLVILPDDIILENYEQDFFEGGIDIDVDGITIDGAGKIIDAKGRSRIFNICAKNVTLKNITFKNGFCENTFDKHTAGGGAIRNIKCSDVTIENCSFISNVSSDDAGAILNNGILTSKNNHFHDNSSGMWGGAILNNDVIHIIGDEYVGNSSKMAGAVYNRCEMHIEDEIKTDKNSSNIDQPILNANSLKLENLSLDEIIYNTGDINATERGSFKSMDYLARELNNSKRISIKSDIVHECDCRLKEIAINEECEIDGEGHTIDFNAISFNFIINAKVTFKNISFKNAYVLEESLFKVNAETTFENTRFLNNRLASKSSLIDVGEKGYLTLKDSYYLNNSSKKRSLVRNRGLCEIFNCYFANNDSQARGGIIYNELNNREGVLIDESIFEYNSSDRSGVLFNDIWAVLKIQNSKLIKNTAEYSGGALTCNGKVDLENCSFIQNSAEQGGAVIVSSDSDVSFSGCKFKSNRAEYGGGLLISGETSFIGCQFTSNIAKNEGGAIFAHGDSNSLLFECILEKNSAESGGAIYEDYSAKVKLIDTKFSHNVPDDRT